MKKCYWASGQNQSKIHKQVVHPDLGTTGHIERRGGVQHRLAATDGTVKSPRGQKVNVFEDLQTTGSTWIWNQLTGLVRTLGKKRERDMSMCVYLLYISCITYLLNLILLCKRQMQKKHIVFINPNVHRCAGFHMVKPPRLSQAWELHQIGSLLGLETRPVIQLQKQMKKRFLCMPTSQKARWQPGVFGFVLQDSTCSEFWTPKNTPGLKNLTAQSPSCTSRGGMDVMSILQQQLDTPGTQKTGAARHADGRLGCCRRHQAKETPHSEAEAEGVSGWARHSGSRDNGPTTGPLQCKKKVCHGRMSEAAGTPSCCTIFLQQSIGPLYKAASFWGWFINLSAFLSSAAGVIPQNRLFAPHGYDVKGLHRHRHSEPGPGAFCCNTALSPQVFDDSASIVIVSGPAFFSLAKLRLFIIQCLQAPFLEGDNDMKFIVHQRFTPFILTAGHLCQANWDSQQKACAKVGRNAFFHLARCLARPFYPFGLGCDTIGGEKKVYLFKDFSSCIQRNLPTMDHISYLYYVQYIVYTEWNPKTLKVLDG